LDTVCRTFADDLVDRDLLIALEFAEECHPDSLLKLGDRGNFLQQWLKET